jgi:RNA methyltransferase, TrmH family
MSERPSVIRSRSHPVIRALRSLARSRQERSEHGAYLAGGVRVLEEALRCGAPLESVVCSPRLAHEPRGVVLERRLRAAAPSVHDTTDDILGWVLGMKRHQGVVARMALPEPAPEDLAGEGLLLVAWGVQDPGNLGGLLRVAAAVGASSVRTVESTADLFHPKSVRASAGSLFRLPVARHSEGAQLLATLTARGILLVGAVAHGGTPTDGLPWGESSVALIVGGEGAGLPDAAIAEMDRLVSIPMAPGVESLNVLAATTVLLYDAARRRGFPARL